jgi:hypothetical protein
VSDVAHGPLVLIENLSIEIQDLGTNELNVKTTSTLFFYAPEIEDQGAYCFCPVCHSVICQNFNLGHDF